MKDKEEGEAIRRIESAKDRELDLEIVCVCVSWSEVGLSAASNFF